VGSRASGRARPPEGAFDPVLMEKGIRLFLRGIGQGEDGVLRKTPKLVAEAWRRELLAGYREEASKVVIPLPERPPEALVAVRGIRFVSICRHHLLPFQGTAAVGYLPRHHLAGFSSLARLVDVFARRLQIQEDLGEDILDGLESSLAPRGSACLLRATHQCMTCRGALQPGARVTTLRMRGIFQRNSKRRQEMLMLLQDRARGERKTR